MRICVDRETLCPIRIKDDACSIHANKKLVIKDKKVYEKYREMLTRLEGYVVYGHPYNDGPETGFVVRHNKKEYCIPHYLVEKL